MNDIKITLEAARVNSGLTQKEAAEKVGVSVNTLINWEKNRTAPTIDYAIKLSQTYDIGLDHLIFFKPASI